ncbi:hypothetical protein TESG_06693 [Trichophyton tonsurans CBS 112818]|uniref:Uncharacterized protein n=1 Tax=Trichophyton tonsurans (strain CBS 112818) TaxID=647933 RepID=F2S6Y9_TRIT1|nr:hypothetical protein TESG_06693 [Trichophyton tonsurans CBS 112818]
MFTNQRAAETDGDFTTIFGAYVYNWYTGQEDRSIYTVDCRVSYGWVSITQVGSNPPEVLRSSFEVVGKDELPRSAGYLPFAQRIERAWYMDNIFAFGRSIDRIDLSTTIETRVNKYVYNKLALFILIVPFLASLLSVWNRWHLLSDELMLGYDPVRIVRCGPLYRVDPSTTAEELDKTVVARYRQADVYGEEGYQFVASSAEFVAEPRTPKHG